MDSRNQGNIVAIMACIDIVIMKRGNANYHLVLAKLNSLYNCTIMDCYENPKYLRTVLKEVYKKDYNSVIKDIKLELDYLSNIEEEKASILKIMES